MIALDKKFRKRKRGSFGLIDKIRIIVLMPEVIFAENLIGFPSVKACRQYVEWIEVYSPSEKTDRQSRRATVPK